MIIEDLTIGKKIPTFEKEYLKIRNYCENSYECDVDYVDSHDAKGNSIIQKFDCESNTGFGNRKSRVVAENITKPLVDKFISAVYKNKVVRPDNFPITDKIAKKACQDMLVSGFGAMVIINNNIEDISLAQNYDLNISPYEILYLENEKIVYMEEEDGNISEIIIELYNPETGCFFRYYNSQVYIDILVNKNMMITSLSEPIPHGFSNIPIAISMINNDYDDPFIFNIAEAQKFITNLKSLITQDIFESVFIQRFVTGIKDIGNKSEEEMNLVRAQLGNSRMALLDEGQEIKIIEPGKNSYEIISEERNVTFKNTLNSYGLKPDATNSTSGYAIRLEMNTFFNLCESISSAMEDAENYLLSLISTNETVKYSDDYTTWNYSEEITVVRDIIALDFPLEFKEKVKKMFMDKYQ